MSSKEKSKNKSKDKKRSKTAHKTKNKKKKQDPWASFWSTTVYTIVFFWVLFPFYSYQLQLVFDQRQCKGQTPNDKTQGGGGKCYLPHNRKNVPYYPCPNGNLPENSLEGKKCPEEHVKGPDMFHMMLHFARSIFRDGYSILVGEAWIKADEQSKKAINQLNNNNQTNEKTTSNKNMKGGNPVAGTTQMNISNAKNNGIKTGNDIAMSVMEQTFNVSASTIKKHNKKSICCNQFTKYGLAEEQMRACTKNKENLFDYPPFSWVMPNKFGWPYSYIFDDPTVKENTAYNPNGTDEEAGMNRWMGAWFAKTQQRSWSSSRSIWSNILSFFLPYIHEELESELVSDRIDEFIKNLDDKILEMKSNKEKGKVKSKNLQKLNEIKSNFNNIRESFDKAWKKDNIMNKRSGKKVNGRELLLQVLEGSWSKTKTQNYFNKGLAERGNDEEKENIYLNFFIAATKPEDLRKWRGASFLWNFIKGDYRYWFRYFTTLYMPMLTMLVVFIAMGCGLFLTPFSSINRYSSFVLPLLFGFGTTLYNVGTMPMSAFYYMLFGAAGDRDSSTKCPYDGGIYQMKRNAKAYWPINLFITLAIICSSLGSALVADGNSWGWLVGSAFPILILLRMVIYLAHVLWKSL